MTRLTVPGVVDDLIRNGSWKTEQPAMWDDYNTGARKVRHGKGFRVTTVVDPATSVDLAEYLTTVRDALASMTNEERGPDGNTDLRALNAALNRWPSTPCLWSLLCANDAVATRWGPVGQGRMGNVPICRRCDDKVASL